MNICKDHYRMIIHILVDKKTPWKVKDIFRQQRNNCLIIDMSQ